jgi:hypothetical protein
MAKITVVIQDYGTIVVKQPKKLTEQTYGDGISEVVAKTCQLLDPRVQGERFHPALGMGGYNMRKDSTNG